MQEQCTVSKHLTHDESKSNMDTGRRVRNLLFWLCGWIIICLWWKWHSWLPSKGVPHDGQGLLPAHHHSHALTYTHTHTSSNRHTHIHLHTPTHMQSSAVSATRRMLSSHTQRGQDFHHKIISREWSHTEPLSPKQPTSSDKNVTKCTVSSFGQIHQNVTTARLTHLTPYISVRFHHLVLFWHQSPAHHWCTYAHLSVTQCYKRKLIWVSQSAAECFIRHTVVCVHSALSPLFSLALSLRPARRTICLFRFTLTIDHFGESRHNDSNAYCISAGLQGLFTVSTRCGPHSGYVCMLGFQEPYANTEWEGSHLVIQHSVYEWVRLHSISMQPQHTSWKLACACVCECVC